MATVLKTLADEYPADNSTSWVSINAEELSDLSEKYDVTAVPFLVLSRDGKVLETVSGSSAVKVRTAIETHAGKAGSAATNGNGSEATNGGAMEVDEQELDPAKAKEELNKRLEELVKAAPVMLFMKGKPSAPQCGFSRQIVAMLREHSVKYGFFDILADDEVRQGLKEFADWPTYPQLWIDGELVGGLDIVSTTRFYSWPSSANTFLGQRGDREQPRLPETLCCEQRVKASKQRNCFTSEIVEPSTFQRQCYDPSRRHSQAQEDLSRASVVADQALSRPGPNRAGDSLRPMEYSIKRHLSTSLLT